MYQLRNQDKIAQRIKAQIKLRGWTYCYVAEKLDTRPSYISAMLCGSRDLTPDKIFAFSELLGTPIDYLVHDSKNIIRMQPDITDEHSYMPTMLMDSPLTDIMIPARTHGYDRINGILKDDFIMVYKQAPEEKIQDEKIVVVSLKMQPPILARTRISKGSIRIFYFDNGEPPVISDDYKIYGIVKKIVRNM